MFDMGLALFQKFVVQRKFERTLKSETYFLERAKREPVHRLELVYIGTLETSVKNNPVKGFE